MDNNKNKDVKGAKKKLVIWIAVLVILIGSSYFIYNYIGDPNSVARDMFFKDTKDGDNTEIADKDGNGDKNQGIEEDKNKSENEDRDEDANVGKDEDKNTDEDKNSNKVKSIDFTLKDFNGNEVSLSDYRGKLVILNFWASWCPPCISEMPDFDSVNKELTEEDDVVILTVNLTNGYRGETEEVAREFINKNGYTLPVLFDTEGFAAQNYGIRSIPTTYFIDKEGYVIDGISGMVNKDFILKAIETYK